MIIDATYKNELANNLAHRLAIAIQNNDISKTEIEFVCRQIESGIQKMVNDTDQATFIDQLTSCWPFFDEVVETVAVPSLDKNK